ncbi:unnamed protein product [Strongylus vulgaris]|uniref:Uncharacterized protein n=1 Tax=Strongylus vulgaris TaxID=40348 RepID=A0A3P7JQ92_STRVU|nr:unnamed protein product [Strongylus vulgaris]
MTTILFSGSYTNHIGADHLLHYRTAKWTGSFCFQVGHNRTTALGNRPTYTRILRSLRQRELTNYQYSMRNARNKQIN